jgi:hypothetical protein
MSAETGPVKVRIVGTSGQQVLGVVLFCAVVAGVVVIARWRTYGPFAATRMARKLRSMADRLEDAGLNLAKRQEP